MANSTLACIPEEVPDFVAPKPCLDEQSAIVAVVLFDLAKFNFSDNDFKDMAAWEAAIASKAVIIIKPVKGVIAESTVEEEEGDGFNNTIFVTRVFDQPFMHRAVDENLSFWDALTSSQEYGFGYIMKDLTMYIPMTRDETAVLPVTFLSKISPVNKKRWFNVNAKWEHKYFPVAKKVPMALARAKANA